MTIQRYRTDDPRTAEEVADAIEAELQTVKSDAPVVRGTENYAFIQAVAGTLAAQQEVSLNQLYDAAYLVDATGDELTKKARGVGVVRQDAIPATGVVTFSRGSPATTDRVAPSGTRVTTGGSDAPVFETTQTAIISGPSTDTDTTLYSTTNTSFTTQTTFTVDVTYRQSVDVSADLSISNNSYVASLDIRDVTNASRIDLFTTQSESLVDKGPTTYDVSSLTGEIDIEFQTKTSNASGSVELDNAQISPGGETKAKANIQCTTTGPEGNVGAGTIDTMLDGYAGIESVTNENATGDPSNFLTDGTTPLNTGADRESDEALRDRALEQTAIGGAGTIAAAELAIANIDEVISADVFSNRSDSISNNISPWHTEVRVYGGDTNVIAQRLYEVLPLGTLITLEGGKNGTKNETTLTLSDLYGDITIPITRPDEISVSVNISVVYDATYAGSDAVKDEIVRYIGGTDTDNRTITGLKQGDNILVNEIENVVEDITGVLYADVAVVDRTGSGTDDTVTNSNGIPWVTFTDSEVPVVDAEDINLNETLQ